eukprot:CAMPEP_0181182502 /NCGR_PEP_ID=MMETSP1096-20121128/7925_1 /TAXON_ID=156174 ORGANISM="Chrysochromulina ericina, Strain CCMP281" /NCGR_SAMPLE_ID=MMETSP1096 /ASSEMBLY_ACC=CAM_ASM_000453 /LENGTH=62 /DNA_ID=CAMNT_0023271117 /DNA_START=525 /DNA_END=713 /DNA_ORIENTATION=-
MGVISDPHLELMWTANSATIDRSTVACNPNQRAKVSVSEISSSAASTFISADGERAMSGRIA